MGDGAKGPCVLVFLVVLFISCFLLGYSFDTLQPNRMGLMYNQNLLWLDTSRVYNGPLDESGGRWFTGLGQGFIEFPKQLLTMTLSSDFSGTQGPTMLCTAEDGNMLQVAFSYQYQLLPNGATLGSLYTLYGEGIDAILPLYTRSAIRNVIGRHKVQDVWAAREGLGTEMCRELQVQVPAGIKIVNCQLLRMFIPTELQAAIQMTTVAVQGITTAQYAQQSAVITAETARELAHVDADILVVGAIATSSVTTINAAAVKTSAVSTVQLEIQALKYIQSTLALNNDELLSYMWLQAVGDLNPEKVYIATHVPASIGPV